MKISAVIFDLDGTLYDRSCMPAKMLQASLFHWRFVRAERMSRYALAGSESCLDDLFLKMSKVLHCKEQVCEDWFHSKYMPAQVSIVQKHCQPRPWVGQKLAKLREQNIKIAVLSDYPCAAEKLQALGLDTALFDLVADAPSLGGFKPCALPFLKIARQLGAEPSETLVIGDRLDTDGKGAENAGMQFELITA